MESLYPTGYDEHGQQKKPLLIVTLKDIVKAFRRIFGKSRPTEDTELLLIREALQNQFSLLPASSIKTNSNKIDEGISEEAIFHNFLSKYASEKVANNGSLNIDDLKSNHSVLIETADIVLGYLKACDSLEAPLDGLMRRLIFRHLSVLNKQSRAGILNYRKELPRVGMFYFPNSEPRDFLIDALNGQVVIDDMEPGRLLERTWVGRPYDFHRYQNELKQQLKLSLEQLPKELMDSYPSKDWIEAEVFDNCQYQFALQELLQRKEWDLIFIGSPEQPLGLSMFDISNDLLPPIVYLCHGMLAGDPVMDFWLKFDRVLTRGTVEESYCKKLGIPSNKIVEIGSITLESFPAPTALAAKRSQARAALGLSSDQTVIVYALTYDVYRADQSTLVARQIIESLECLNAKNTLAAPVLFLKYHPAPSGDSTFSYSRNQYPLQLFMSLGELGFSVRINDNLDLLLAAADCFIAHESTTLVKALENGVPTMSLSYTAGKAEPVLGWPTYATNNCHKYRPIDDKVSLISKDLEDLLSLDKEVSYEESCKTWQNIFKIGRTQSLSVVGSLASELISSSKKPV